MVGLVNGLPMTNHSRMAATLELVALQQADMAPGLMLAIKTAAMRQVPAMAKGPMGNHRRHRLLEVLLTTCIKRLSGCCRHPKQPSQGFVKPSAQQNRSITLYVLKVLPKGTMAHLQRRGAATAMALAEAGMDRGNTQAAMGRHPPSVPTTLPSPATRLLQRWATFWAYRTLQAVWMAYATLDKLVRGAVLESLRRQCIECYSVQIVPIASLNAYQNRWTIKARVTQRSDIRRYMNAKGEGKFFTVDLLDAQGGEIRAISFNEVADKFDPILQMGAVVLISKASLKPKKPGSVSSTRACGRGNEGQPCLRYMHVTLRTSIPHSWCLCSVSYSALLLMQTYNQTRHDHEITMEKQTVVELVEDDQNENEIPQIQYHVSLLTTCT